MKVVSCFAGLGGGELALKQLGFKTEVYAYEIDVYAEAVNRFHNSDNTTYLGDITKWREHTDLIGDGIDLIMGGSPCQDLSGANVQGEGKCGAGLCGSRSGLFYTFIDILNHYKPRYYFLENVASMTTENKNKMSAIMGHDPYVVDARTVSGMMRKRLFWTNIPFEPIKDRGIKIQDILSFGKYPKEKAYTIAATYTNASLNRDYFASHRPMKFIPLDEDNVSRYEREWGYNSINSRVVKVENGKVNFKDAELLKKRKHIDDVGNLEDGFYRLEKFTLNEVEQCFTLPIDYTRYGKFADGTEKQISNTQRYKMIGNGWVIDVIKEFFKNIGDY